MTQRLSVGKTGDLLHDRHHKPWTYGRIMVGRA